MQTFLPYSSFEKSAEVLDYKRLGKQRLEARDAIVVLTGECPSKMSEKQYWYVQKRWRYHIIPKLWKGCSESLKLYFNIISNEWKKRGYKHNLGFYKISNNVIYPVWLGNELFHSAHRSALLKKNFVYYSKFGWKEEPKIEYPSLELLGL